MIQSLEDFARGFIVTIGWFISLMAVLSYISWIRLYGPYIALKIARENVAQQRRVKAGDAVDEGMGTFYRGRIARS